MGDSEADENRYGALDDYDRWAASQVAQGMCCGSCELFTDEDALGVGWCQFSDGQSECGKTCRHWTKRVT